MYFTDRKDAGEQLTAELKEYKNRSDVVVVALPRGGVITGYEVAKQLHAELDIVCPKKIPAPDYPEYAIGAVTETGEKLFDYEAIKRLGIPTEYLKTSSAYVQSLAQEKLQSYRKGRPKVALGNKIVILVDDGLATGFTMMAAIQSIKKENPKKIIVAIPVAPPDTVAKIQSLVDEVYCLYAPPFFQAVGQFYEQFDQTQDSEVIHLLNHY